MRDILVRARELIADPEHWTQDNYATDNTGAPADLFDDERPYRMCLVGALYRAAFELHVTDFAPDMSEDRKIAWLENPGPASAALEHLQQFVPSLVSDFNDEHPHTDVIAVLDEAIEKAPA
jgi:hypothetical protein